MSETFRDLLRRRAADAGGAPGGLTEGALSKAEAIGRRRLAAAAAGAVCGMAIAGVAVAALIAPDGSAPAPPAVERTTIDAPTPDEPTPAEPTGAMPEAPDCGGMRPSEWDERGFTWPDLEPSETPVPEAIPQRLYFLVGEMHSPYTALLEGDVVTSLNGGEGDALLEPAPNGERALISGTGASGSWCEWSYADLTEPDAEPLAAFTADPECPPSWSPDSNRVVIAEPASTEDAESYVFDLTTGERLPLPEGVGCSPVWTPDGQYLVGEGSAVRPDGSGRIDLPGLARWTRDPDVRGLESVSADLSRACLFIQEKDNADIRSFDRCGKYIDTATGDELELPVDEAIGQVVFLPDGSMLVTGMTGASATLYLVDEAGDVADQRPLPWTEDTVEWLKLLGYGP
ncbi:hypothetical protein [Glycomyces arizonensis]|uniref:hypothetical protein n=1 Tax=Glycomyces arizonensis TaxID=256035 RepID=UPI00041551BA|nr:hypothetical protein [Glycomyces arizonensis]